MIESQAQTQAVRVGVSQCLLGDWVRYDGGEQRDPWVADHLARVWYLAPVCPEMAIGLGVPRPPIHLVQTDTSLIARGVAAPKQDVTAKLQQLVVDGAAQFAQLHGFLLMERSPSCGLGSVKIHTATGEFTSRGADGIFAASLRTHLPWLPLIEAVQLSNPLVRAHFFTQVAALHDFNLSVIEGGVSAAKLVNFYSRYKYLVMAQGGAGYKTLGPMLANLKGDLVARSDEFKSALMRSLRDMPTRRSHVNALQHLLGYFREPLTAVDYRELQDAIERFGAGTGEDYLLDLARVREIFMKCLEGERLKCTNFSYVATQAYWQPYPAHWDDTRLTNEQ